MPWVAVAAAAASIVASAKENSAFIPYTGEPPLRLPRPTSPTPTNCCNCGAPYEPVCSYCKTNHHDNHTS